MVINNLCLNIVTSIDKFEEVLDKIDIKKFTKGGLNKIRITIIVTIFKSLITTIFTAAVVASATPVVEVAVLRNLIVYKIFMVF